jgi:hypothetical protein
MKWLAMGLTNEDLWLTLYVIFSFVLFISGLFLGALISRNRRKAREPWYARLAAAKGVASTLVAGVTRDGMVRSANTLAFVIALVVGLAVLDHFTGPLLPGVFYSRK